MRETSVIHNQFREGITAFEQQDPHLKALAQMQYSYQFHWWQELSMETPGIYMLTGGRQVGKSTSCKQLLLHCLQQKFFSAEQLLYITCDEIFDAHTLSDTLRYHIDKMPEGLFFIIIDEIIFVENWDRVIKALADEGIFKRGLCLLTGSDTLILKEATMRFPGRRGNATKTDFHLYPLSFREYVGLCVTEKKPTDELLYQHFQDYLQCGGYLRAINDMAEHQKVLPATFTTYEQWIRGDFIKQRKNEDILIAILRALLTINVAPVSYSALTQHIGLISKETCIDYCQLLKRMDVLTTLGAFDQNKKIAFPRKAQKFHFNDPFIVRAIHHWLEKEGQANQMPDDSILVEACVASHIQRTAKTFYFKGQGEVDVIRFENNMVEAIEVKWAKQLRSHDLKTLKNFHNAVILCKQPHTGKIEHMTAMPVYRYLLSLDI